jgi:hypothetical protein
MGGLKLSGELSLLIKGGGPSRGISTGFRFLDESTTSAEAGGIKSRRIQRAVGIETIAPTPKQPLQITCKREGANTPNPIAVRHDTPTTVKPARIGRTTDKILLPRSAIALGLKSCKGISATTGNTELVGGYINVVPFQ